MSTHNLTEYNVQVIIDDINTAETGYVVIPDAGNIVRISSVVDTTTVGATIITATANFVALSPAVTHTIPSGSVNTAAVISYHDSPIAEGAVLRLISNGGTTSTSKCYFTVTIRR